MRKISLIIPCYNAVSTIDICLQSVVNQTIGIGNMEVILVNDASTDATFDKLCEWEKKYPDSILVVNCSENGKQGQARNIGMQYAAGEYIAFMDDDDIIEPQMYETLYQKAVENQCDVVVCQSVKQEGYQLVSEQMEAEEDELFDISTAEERHALFYRDINRAIWNKIYKRSFLLEKEIYFIRDNIYDDIFFSALVKQYCSRVYISKKVFYHHVISKSCASYNNDMVNTIAYYQVHACLLREIKARGAYEQYSAYWDALFISEFIIFIETFAKRHGEMPSELYESIKQEVMELFPQYDKNPVIKDIFKELFGEIS